MKFGVVTFPGSNCDQDALYVLGQVLGYPVVHLWHKDTDLQGADFILLPGGFSYGDYLRSGAIARFSPIMAEVVAHANRGGYVGGICNGFQVLTEVGLLPGALLRNEGRRFICDYVYLKPANFQNRFTHQMPDAVYQIPIAHGDGRYYASASELQQLEDNNQVLFRYCDSQGNVTSEANPNGSMNSIAGVSNRAGNVFGMMPHPERAAHELQNGCTDGRVLLQALVGSLRELVG